MNKNVMPQKLCPRNHQNECDGALSYYHEAPNGNDYYYCSRCYGRELEDLAEKLHDIYQAEAKRQGDVRHHDDYTALPENIKEYDRVLARFIISELSAERERIVEMARGMKIDEKGIAENPFYGTMAAMRHAHSYNQALSDLIARIEKT